MKRQPLTHVTSTLRPQTAPVSALLVRAALGMALMLGGGALTWAATIPALTQQFEATRTQRKVEMQAGDTLRLEGDRSSLRVQAIDQAIDAGVTLEAGHRALNPLMVEAERRAGERTVTAGLYTDLASERDSLIGLQPANIALFLPRHQWPTQFQHTLVAGVGVGGLQLQTSTLFGSQTLDLSGLRVAGLEAKSVTGDIALTLPKAADKAITVYSGHGDLAVSGDVAGAHEVGAHEPLPSLKLSTQFGDIQANLSAAAVRHLEVASEHGDIALSLPAKAALDAEVQTEHGDQSIDVPAGVYGRLQMSSDVGDVVLTVPQNAAYTVRLSAHHAAAYGENPTRLSQRRLTEVADNLPQNLTEKDGVWYSPAALQQLEAGNDAAKVLHIRFDLGLGGAMNAGELSILEAPATDHP